MFADARTRHWCSGAAGRSSCTTSCRCAAEPKGTPVTNGRLAIQSNQAAPCVISTQVHTRAARQHAEGMGDVAYGSGGSWTGSMSGKSSSEHHSAESSITAFNQFQKSGNWTRVG